MLDGVEAIETAGGWTYAASRARNNGARPARGGTGPPLRAGVGGELTTTHRSLIALGWLWTAASLAASTASDAPPNESREPRGAGGRAPAHVQQQVPARTPNELHRPPASATVGSTPHPIAPTTARLPAAGDGHRAPPVASGQVIRAPALQNRVPPGAPPPSSAVAMTRASRVNGPVLDAGHAVGHGPAVAMDRTSLVRPRLDGSGYTAVRTQATGARIVVSERRLPSGAVQVLAYKEQTSASGQTVARLYADGHRVVQGPNFSSQGVAGGTQVVSYRNGLHAAYLANGRPLYTERSVTTTQENGTSVQVVQRISYIRTLSPYGAAEWTPFVRLYPLGAMMAGIGLYAYQAVPYPPVYYVPLYRPFAAQIVVAPGCPLCPPPSVAFEVPTSSYANPMDMLGDRVIGDATVDPAPADPAQYDAPGATPPAEPGSSQASPDASATAGTTGGATDGLPSAIRSDPATDVEAHAAPPPPDMVVAAAGSSPEATAELAALTGTASELRKSVADTAASHPALARSIPDAHLTPAMLVDPSNEPGASVGADPEVRLTVPEYAREQLRKEVRFEAALQQNQRPLLLSSIVKSDYAKIFVFQASSPIDVETVEERRQCTLSAGDVLGFAAVPAETDAVVTMKVIASTAGHCRANDAVELGLSDLQDMLNAFSERVEHEMKRMNACQSPGGACVRI